MGEFRHWATGLRYDLFPTRMEAQAMASAVHAVRTALILGQAFGKFIGDDPLPQSGTTAW